MTYPTADELHLSQPIKSCFCIYSALIHCWQWYMILEPALCDRLNVSSLFDWTCYSLIESSYQAAVFWWLNGYVQYVFFGIHWWLWTYWESIMLEFIYFIWWLEFWQEKFRCWHKKNYFYSAVNFRKYPLTFKTYVKIQKMFSVRWSTGWKHDHRIFC